MSGEWVLVRCGIRTCKKFGAWGNHNRTRSMSTAASPRKLRAPLVWRNFIVWSQKRKGCIKQSLMKLQEETAVSRDLPPRKFSKNSCTCVFFPKSLVVFVVEESYNRCRCYNSIQFPNAVWHMGFLFRKNCVMSNKSSVGLPFHQGVLKLDHHLVGLSSEFILAIETLHLVPDTSDITLNYIKWMAGTQPLPTKYRNHSWRIVH